MMIISEIRFSMRRGLKGSWKGKMLVNLGACQAIFAKPLTQERFPGEIMMKGIANKFIALL